ncbi:MAG: ABC transporter substrate-binding protein [Candidatus Kariarchaeaceae archaeon]|jgi:ABC-type transport system substrate-binding protein
MKQIKNSIFFSFLIFSCLFLIFVSLTNLNITAKENPDLIDHKDPLWYYFNLDSDDRKKIRQSMDYCIPRQQIIDGLHNGLAYPLATDIAPNVMGFDNSVQSRIPNTTKAVELLTEVFGPDFDQHFFNITLVCPSTSGGGYTQSSYLVLQSFEGAGIGCEIKWWNWNRIIPRIYLDPVGIGLDFAHGGIDAWFVGMNANPDPLLHTSYYKEYFPPNGDNAFWIENDEVRDIINRSLTNPDPSGRISALKEFQHWFYDEVPKSIIRQKINIFAVDEQLEGFDSHLVGRGWCFNNWTIGSQTEMTYTVPGDFLDFNPLISNSYYDLVPMSNVFGALNQRRGAYNLTHPVPQIAESWNQNTDGTVWEVKVRSGIKWDDGTDLTTDDVLFSYHAVFSDNLASPYQEFFLERFPNDRSDIYLKDGTNDTVVFELGAFYPYVTSQVFALPILQKAQMEGIVFDDWKTHSLNTGTGPEYLIGCGPYMMTDFDLSVGVTLEINPYFDETTFGHDPDAVGGGIFMTNPTIAEIHVAVVKEATTAIAGLASGIYDAIDCYTSLQAQYDDLNAPDNEYNSKCINALEYGCLELNYNHYSPKWGMNPHDPREMYPNDYPSMEDIPTLVFDPFILMRLGLFSAFSGAFVTIVIERLSNNKN